MAVDYVHMPDLWLKRALAFSLLDEGETTFRLSGKTLIECVRAGRGTVFDLNHMIAGDAPVGVKTDLYFLAATFEYLLLHGPEGPLNHKTVAAFVADRPEGLGLWPGPILGTYSQFAVALLALMKGRSDWSPERENHYRASMGRVLRQKLRDDMEKKTDPATRLHVLWGASRNWALSPSGLERIIRQPEHETPVISVGDFMQIVVPTAPSHQWVFGFEIRTDDLSVTEPWERTGGWFAPRVQRMGDTTALLPEFEDDERNCTAEEPGTFWIQLAGVDVPPGINEPPSLPPELAKLVSNAPADWPFGYAEAMATVTYVARLHDRRKKASNRKAREEVWLEPKAGHEVTVPSRARLYRQEYRVVGRDDYT